MANEEKTAEGLLTSEKASIHNHVACETCKSPDPDTLVPPEATTKPESEHPNGSATAYSVFTTNQKKAIIFFGSLGAVFSTMTTTIYYPALNTLAADLHVSNAKINLTITTFQIFQGIAPMLVAGFSDSIGRRPSYIACFIIFLAANIGLAVQKNYAALMVLRCLQSAGCSGTIALSYGVTADITTSADRGRYIGLTSVTWIVGPTIGPILGGVISEYLGWPWIFWFLTISSGVYLLFFVLFFPETCRKAVGDGSIYPPLMNRDLSSIIRERNRVKKKLPVNEAAKAEVAKGYRLSMLNPLSTLIILADRGSSVLLISSALVIACLYAVNAGIPSQFESIYHYSDSNIGYVYVSFGAGSIVSAITTGPLVDWNWRRLAHKHNFAIEKDQLQDLTDFPLEHARLDIGIPLLYISCIFLVVFGWVLQAQTFVAGPIVALLFAGYGMMAAFQILQILVVDLNPGHAAAATAANNLIRCLLGAGATSIVVPMFEKIGVGWTYTFFALVWAGFSLSLLYQLRVGPRWRKQKKGQEDD